MRNLLDSATLLRLAYNGSDGFPRAIPIGFYWNGARSSSARQRPAPKVKALSSRPCEGVPDEYVAASRNALGAAQVRQFERQVRSMYDEMARISIEPVWARFFDSGAGRMPSFLMKLAGDA